MEEIYIHESVSIMLKYHIYMSETFSLRLLLRRFKSNLLILGKYKNQGMV